MNVLQDSLCVNVFLTVTTQTLLCSNKFSFNELMNYSILFLIEFLSVDSVVAVARYGQQVEE